MNRIMVLGIGPLSIEDSTTFHAGGNRAWHLTKALLDEGFEVVLVCMGITGGDAQTGLERVKEDGRLTYILCDELQCFARDEYLQEKINAYQPCALVGACDYPAARACAVAGALPVWADIHGYPMGEAQAKAYHENEPGFLHHFWNIHRQALLRADRFSVTSERQRMATLGELGAMGRLNPGVFCEDLVCEIPIAWDPRTPYAPPQRQRNEPLTVFSCGGYNHWCDEATLFAGLERAMQRDERIRFLSTGGAIAGHDERTYPRFLQRVEASPYRERFDLRGWVPKAELAQCYAQAHVGITVDLPCVESLIGARNRITEWMARGLPVIATRMPEISEVLHHNDAALTTPTGDAEALADAIVEAAEQPERMQEKAQRARQLFEARYTYQPSTKALSAWCRNPQRSGDALHAPVILDYRHFPAGEGQMGLKERFLKFLKGVIMSG